MLDNYIAEVLVSPEELKETIQKLGEKLTVEYQDKNPLVICILKGAIFFMTDLVRAMDCDLEVDFMDVSSYHGGTESSGVIKIKKDCGMDIEGRHVIIVEDIVDTGRTLKALIENLKERKVASVACASLVDKPETRVVDVEADYIGMVSPNEFLVGFGLDYDERYRNLPYIGVLKEEIYS